MMKTIEQHKSLPSQEAANGREKPQEQEQPKEAGHECPELWRSLCAEFFGTFALTLVAAGGEVIAAVSKGEVSHAARAVAPGLLIMALIYAIGDSSGAHFNPAVTLAFAARGAFRWTRVPGYWLTQITGAVAAAFLLHALFGSAGHLGANTPHHGMMAALVMELALSCLLYIVILGTATRYSLVGPDAAIAVGGTIILCGLFAAPISGASMNPARSLGPALVSGELEHVWIYLVGPLTASLLAVGLMDILHQKHDPKEAEAAEGDGGKDGK